MSGNNVINTIVLSSCENFVWTSMQEIIPSLEDVWRNSENEGHRVSVFIVEKHPISQLIAAIFKSDNIVFTCFTMRIARIAKLIRSEFQIDTRFIVHLHGLATIGLWPIYKYGMGETLMEKDIFISTCKRDQKCLHLSLDSPNSKVIPFSLTDLNQKMEMPIIDNASKVINLCYVGRISAQKNLHTLLYALHLLVQDRNLKFKFVLNIFGGEDNLGSPNMELYQPGYEKYLKKLVKELSLDKYVKFMGFIDRSRLRREYLNRPHIILSTSLHSDENFGISALRSLSKGCPALLSDWGGHTDYSITFPSQVSLIPVYRSNSGPFINPFSICRSLRSIFESYTHTISPFLPNCYQRNEISSQLMNIAKSKACSNSPLRTTATVQKVMRKQDIYLQKNQENLNNIIETKTGCKIFANYSDRLGHKFLESYGMEKKVDTSHTIKRAITPPWVTVQKNLILISDFHRGDYTFQLEAGNYELQDSIGRSHFVSQDIFTNIINMGYAFIRPE
ncbi:MAG: glycosyltransferase family 4 protein [Bacteriovoracaceae bacterium]|nr:glycosyltransferase family 4 protein [Bacteriovoracaceae bacterium]